MNAQLFSITNMGSKKYPKPGISCCPGWLQGRGFTPGVLVQALPEPDGGAVFSLCDENIRKYSELDAATQEKGGKLIQMGYTTVKGARIPLLTVCGQFFTDAGLAIGDTVMARHDFGLIHMRKTPYTVKFVHISKINVGRLKEPMARLRLEGEWLAEFGFVPDSLLTAEAGDGCIVFKLWDEGIEKYKDLVRYARQHKMKLIQVKATKSAYGKLFPHIDVYGSWLDRTGFGLGEKIFALPEQGLIKLQKPDFGGMGF